MPREDSFREGQRVEADVDGRGRFARGEIVRARSGSMYDVEFDNGSTESRIDARSIRALSERRGIPRSGSDEDGQAKGVPPDEGVHGAFVQGERVLVKSAQPATGRQLPFFEGVIERCFADGTYEVGCLGRKGKVITVKVPESEIRSTAHMKANESEPQGKRRCTAHEAQPFQHVPEYHLAYDNGSKIFHLSATKGNYRWSAVVVFEYNARVFFAAASAEADVTQDTLQVGDQVLYEAYPGSEEVATVVQIVNTRVCDIEINTKIIQGVRIAVLRRSLDTSTFRVGMRVIIGDSSGNISYKRHNGTYDLKMMAGGMRKRVPESELSIPNDGPIPRIFTDDKTMNAPSILDVSRFEVKVKAYHEEAIVQGEPSIALRFSFFSQGF
jgi:hypothetical protein